MPNTSSVSIEVKTFEKIVSRFNKVLLSMITSFEVQEEPSEITTEKQLKELAALFKLLQGVEGMLKQIQENRDRRRESGIDALEFRRKLEEQIEKLVNEEASTDMS